MPAVRIEDPVCFVLIHAAITDNSLEIGAKSELKGLRLVPILVTNG